MSHTIELVLVAAGGHAAEVLAYVEQLKTHEIHLIGVVDDRVSAGPWESTHVLGTVASLMQLLPSRGSALSYLTCVGNNAIRRRLVAALSTMADANVLTPWSLIHPTAVVGRSVEIGSGTLLAPQTVVTTRCTIGAHSILNAKASVHHDCRIGNFVNINPGATICGGVSIGDGTFVGAGATVINGKTIGAGVTIGAGTVIVDDIPDDVTVVGVPGRIIKCRTAGEECWGTPPAGSQLGTGRVWRQQYKESQD